MLEPSRPALPARADSRGTAHALLLALLLTSCGDSPAPGREPNPAPGQGLTEQAAGPAGTAVSAGIDWKQDQRLRGLLTNCFEKGHFNRDTSDMLPVLVEKLQASQQSVLRHVREELARIGEPALQELARLVQREYSNRHASHSIVNALGVFRLSEDGGGKTAMELYKICLGHPQESIRIATIRALTSHSGKELFEELKAQLPLTSPAVRLEVVEALYLADPERSSELAFQYLGSGEYPELHDSCARILARTKNPESAQRVVPLVVLEERVSVRAYLLAALEPLPEGGAEALGGLDALLQSEDLSERAIGLAAVMETSRTDWVLRVLREDKSPEMRGRALAFLAELPPTPEIKSAIRQTLNTDNRELRESTLRVLLEMGDPGAADTALEMWGSHIGELELVVRASGGCWEANPDLAQRALKVLKARYLGGASSELAKNESSIQAISQIPGPESTQFLLDQADVATGTIKGHSAYSFFVLEASNTGPAGHALLRDLWWKEEDTSRRFSLLWSATMGHDEATGEFLIEALQAERTHPHERLWIAERLAQEGPASQVAPLIKRANLRMTDPVFRPAMECLLWRWYG